MKLGTKSLLFGAHAFWLHPWFVAWAWWKLYGFPWDPRLWVAFIVHDWGYWGLDKMDDERGEDHPTLGACIMDTFGKGWGDFVMFHSRFLSKRYNREPSRLCYADKLAIALTPWWLYLPMVRLTGEIKEYQRAVKHVEDIGFAFQGNSWHEDRQWFSALQNRMVDFVEAHVRTPALPEPSNS